MGPPPLDHTEILQVPVLSNSFQHSLTLNLSLPCFFPLLFRRFLLLPCITVSLLRSSLFHSLLLSSHSLSLLSFFLPSLLHVCVFFFLLFAFFFPSCYLAIHCHFFFFLFSSRSGLCVSSLGAPGGDRGVLSLERARPPLSPAVCVMDHHGNGHAGSVLRDFQTHGGILHIPLAPPPTELCAVAHAHLCPVVDVFTPGSASWR